MRRSGRQGDHGQVAGSVIARIGRAFTGLPEVRPGIEPYLPRLAGYGWSEGVPPQALLLQVVVDASAGLYRERADPPVELLEFSDAAPDVLFDGAHDPGIRRRHSPTPGPRPTCPPACPSTRPAAPSAVTPPKPGRHTSPCRHGRLGRSEQAILAHDRSATQAQSRPATRLHVNPAVGPMRPAGAHAAPSSFVPSAWRRCQ
jgi:hypothetical protein